MSCSGSLSLQTGKPQVHTAAIVSHGEYRTDDQSDQQVGHEDRHLRDQPHAWR
jgi:hypothetical protein